MKKFVKIVSGAAALAAGIRAGESQAINAAVHMAVEAYKQAKNAIGQKSPTGIFKDEAYRMIVCTHAERNVFAV